MSDTQIATLAPDARGGSRRSNCAHPCPGYVLDAHRVFPKPAARPGTELYQIADLSRRLGARRPLRERRAVHPARGGRSISLPSSEGAPINSRISDVLPQFDPSTRTLKVRLETAQPGVRRCGRTCSSTWRFPVSLPAAITVSRRTPWWTPACERPCSSIAATATSSRARSRPGGGSDDRVESRQGPHAGRAHRRRRQLPARFREPDEDGGDGGRRRRTTDAVCGMEVDQIQGDGRRPHGRRHEGQTYYFCSDTCKQQFDGEPRRVMPVREKENRTSPPAAPRDRRRA